ncbi:MAG: hypothetical protein LPK85_04585, partial [Gammaproteobacteria bacterium]|nr:hypothetical protein [Gammaproteobacteria bacterium]
GRSRQSGDVALSRYRDSLQLGWAAVQAELATALDEFLLALARDLMQSERPSGLDEMQLEQYDVLLEEQAFPFEEQAIALHVSNQQRLTRLDTLDPWVQKSLQALAEMFPARYARTLRRME